MRRPNRADNTFADARDDCFLSRAADEPIEMRAHRDPRFDFDPDAILRDAVNRCPAHGWIRRINDFRIDAGAHRFQDCFAGAFGCQVYGACAVEIERNTRLIGSDQGEHHVAHITTCKVMGF